MVEIRQPETEDPERVGEDEREGDDNDGLTEEEVEEATSGG